MRLTWLGTLEEKPAKRKSAIKVVEKPGADFHAPPHTEGEGDCWCLPGVFETEDAIYVEHRAFEN